MNEIPSSMAESSIQVPKCTPLGFLGSLIYQINTVLQNSSYHALVQDSFTFFKNDTVKVFDYLCLINEKMSVEIDNAMSVQLTYLTYHM